jgi:hypothetical protein
MTDKQLVIYHRAKKNATRHEGNANQSQNEVPRHITGMTKIKDGCWVFTQQKGGQKGTLCGVSFINIWGAGRALMT